MKFFCTVLFKETIESLSGKKPYRNIIAEVSDYFHNKSIQEICSGTRLNNSDTAPYIKKRLNGSGGYRLYFLILIQKENVCLIFIHPKTGPDGSENITDSVKAQSTKMYWKQLKAKNCFA
jgi:hypothetical protein